MKEPGLKKTLSAFQLLLYGVGTIIGAGIYVLVGKVVGIAGVHAPLAFLLAAILAMFTGLSYAELSSRMPKSAGEVVFVDTAFGISFLSRLVGLIVLLTGIVSAATLLKGFGGYLGTFIQLPSFLVILSLVSLLCFIAILGIGESVWTIGAITILEVAGLIFVLVSASGFAGDAGIHLEQLVSGLGGSSWKEITLGAFLAFYAFIGFEDLANVAEEARDPSRSMPFSIVASVLISTVLYMGVAVLCVLAIPVDILGASEAPLAELLSLKGGVYVYIISLVSLIAIVNGVMVQLIMGSRVIYGMSEQRLAPSFFYRLSRKYRTPVRATVFIGIVVAILSLSFPLVRLAETASLLILIVFILVNLSLFFIKRREGPTYSGFHIPSFIPMTGAVMSMLMILIKLLDIANLL